jgi:hypothetical protein
MLDSSLEHQSSRSEILGVTFSKQNKDSLLVHDKPRIRLFSIKKNPTTVTNQEQSTFPVHRAQSAFLIKNS